MNIGNPPRPYFLDVDTGSDLTWLQCDAPCISCNKVPFRPHHLPWLLCLWIQAGTRLPIISNLGAGVISRSIVGDLDIILAQSFYLDWLVYKWQSIQFKKCLFCFSQTWFPFQDLVSGHSLTLHHITDETCYFFLAQHISFNLELAFDVACYVNCWCRCHTHSTDQQRASWCHVWISCVHLSMVD